MEKLKLIRPTIEYANDIMDFRQEILDTQDSFAGCGSLKNCSAAEEWIKILAEMENEETCPKGGVPSDTYLAIRLFDNKIVGIIDLRHHIDHPVLSVWGGHMGYSVRPSERRKGYGKEILRQNLQNCLDRGIDKVLITCDANNIASEKIIITNGGVFEKQISIDDSIINRYWIYL